MKGLIASTSGEIIEFPILSCSKEGLTPIEYFITTHGARKGLTDTALNTAKAGYLTRKLFVVAQDVMISEDDCGTKESIIIKKQSASGIEIPLSKNIRGRVLAENVESSDGKVMFKKGHLLSKGEAQAIEAAGITAVHVRSPLSCKTSSRRMRAMLWTRSRQERDDRPRRSGRHCSRPSHRRTRNPADYAHFPLRRRRIGSRRHHCRLPRVEEIFEKRSPRNPAVVATVDGVVSEIKDMAKEKVIVVIPDLEHIVPSKSKVKEKTDRRRQDRSNRISVPLPPHAFCQSRRQGQERRASDRRVCRYRGCFR